VSWRSDELADSIRGLAREEAQAVSPPVSRFKVLRVNPLTVEELDGDLVLEEGDPDVEFDRALLALRPAVGDVVRVHRDGVDYIVSGVID
jgi:hypothetical protein